MLKIDVTSEVNNKLRALLHFAGKKDVRYYLNGVLIDAQSGIVRGVATNGHILGVTILASGADVPNGQWIVSRELIERMVKTKDFYSLTIDATTITGSHGHSGALVDGKYPDWRRVSKYTEGNTPAPANFDPEYFAAIGKASQCLGNKKGYFALNQFGENSARIQLSPDFIGVFMPLRESLTVNVAEYCAVVGE